VSNKKSCYRDYRIGTRSFYPWRTVVSQDCTG